MKYSKYFILILSVFFIFNAVDMVYANPVLQLDISDGWYDATSDVETIIASSDIFTVYALIDTTKLGGPNSPVFTDTFYLSVAVTPILSQQDPAPDLGTFTFNETTDTTATVTTVNVTGDMEFGSPPLEDVLGPSWDPGDLQKHGIFETYYYEYAFTFDSANTAQSYNSMDNPGGIVIGSGDFVYAAFELDISLLQNGYGLHFDLYDNELKLKKGSITDLDVDHFAPFSHDAESGKERAPVPEPATMLLLGCGLVGMIGLKKRRKRSY